MRRILIVDDNPLILAMLSDAFAGDYQVVVASSGEDAMNVLREPAGTPTTDSRKFDLIVTDLNMHEVSGFDLAGYVKTFNRENKFTPVIMLTSADISKEEARKYGCAACVSKADIKKVISMVRILLPR